jgi:deoxyribose-phosphate aldolase
MRLIARPPGPDAARLEERATSIVGRSIDRETRTWALDLAIRAMDLTSLEDSDTEGTIVLLCETALRPDPQDLTIPRPSAVCVFPRFVQVALDRLRGTGVRVASVAGGFPRGGGPLDDRLTEIRDVVELGAQEVDVVLNRAALLAGRADECFEELVAAREAAQDAVLKVILEVGELGTFDLIRQASLLAVAAGADFVKTSTGKIGTGATLASALCMMEAARDLAQETGCSVGVKVAGGIRRSEEAIRYLLLARETLGPAWLTPERLRIGASSLLSDLVAQLELARSNG